MMKTRQPVACFVDSDQEHRDLLKVILGKSGFQVVSFSDSSKLVKYLNNDGNKIRPSFILLDVCADGLGGFEAARRLNQHPHASEIPIIMMAKHCSVEDKLEALGAGAVSCIPKPVTMEAVRAEIDNKKRRVQKNKSIIKQKF